MKALIISGGGSKGAYAGGIAEYLIKDCCNQYELFVGCSTGSLLLPHLALGKIDKIKQIYTTVTQEDIFSISPFKIKKTADGFVTKINHLNTLRTFLKGCPTFGESHNLRKLIRKSITNEEFNQLNQLHKKVVFTISNLTKDAIEYAHSDKCNYEDFCDWAWASCNFIPFMSIFTKNNCQYADGGFGSLTPIKFALENGACDIDVIILEDQKENTNHPQMKNAFSLLFRTFKFMNHHNNDKDIIIGKLIGLNKKVNINFYYAPNHLTENPLIFDPKQMKQWWKDGYEFAKSKNPVSYCHIPNLNHS